MSQLLDSWLELCSRRHYAYAYIMKPSQLFPHISPNVVLDTIAKTPYLDVQWQFQLDLKELGAQYRDQAPYVNIGTSFEAFREQRRKKASFNQFFDEGGLFIELDLFSEYVLGLHDEDASEDLVVELFQRVQKFIESDVLEGDSQNVLSAPALISLLLAPAIRWAALLPKRKNDVISPIETTLLTVSEHLRVLGPMQS